LGVQATNWASRVEVTTDGTGVVGHAGAALLGELADRVGLTTALGWRGPGARRRHPDAAVLGDLAVLLADGGDCLSDLAVLRDQPELFGPVASTPTAWRVIERVGADPDGLARLRAARAHARAWAAGAHPDPELLVVDADATLVLAHSDAKEAAAGTSKGSFGFCPLLAYLDRGQAPGEPLAGLLRPGNATPGAAEDLLALVELALAQLPAAAAGQPVLVRSDRAGGQHPAGLAPAPAWRGVLAGVAGRRPRPRGDPGPTRTGLDTRRRPRRPGPSGRRGGRADRLDRPAHLA
jgi:hypothetical protein